VQGPEQESKAQHNKHNQQHKNWSDLPN
jgi:hypothetical protein